jgi:YfiH family protein
VYFWRGGLGPVELAFTDRLGGVSGAPYDELNLAKVCEDRPEAVAENWRRVIGDFAPGDRLRDMNQVHGDDVQTVEDWRGDTWGPTCDGIVASSRGVVLAVRVADCVPVLLADDGGEVIGAAHAGRPGMVAGVVAPTVSRMRSRGAGEITAWIGPHVCGRCYEVPQQMQDEVTAAVPASRSTTAWGTPALDIGAGVRSQLEELGCRVVEVAACTRETPSLYSYRRDGAAAGRLAGLIRRRS